MTKRDPFKYFKTSPEIIRLAVMLYVRFATIGELAEREGIAHSYMTRVLRLTLLAPDIVEAILDGKQRSDMTLAQVLEPFPGSWAAQLVHLRRTG